MERMERSPAIPKPAASVLILRDGPAGLEVFMVLRSPALDFSSGALVFPGGKVDPEDADAALAARAAGRFGERARAHRIAAVREAFEETGVLLAQRAGRALPPGEAGRIARRWRAEVHAGRASFGDFLRAEDLVADTAALSHCAHWITPEHSARRFDVHFYLAALPPGQEGRHDGSESVDSLWIRPEAALRDAADGSRPIMFPTRAILSRLARSGTVADALRRAEAEAVETVMTRIAATPAGRVLRIPRSAGYPISELALDSRERQP